jgi:hypothetical protein
LSEERWATCRASWKRLSALAYCSVAALSINRHKKDQKSSGCMTVEGCSFQWKLKTTHYPISCALPKASDTFTVNQRPFITILSANTFFF